MTKSSPHSLDLKRVFQHLISWVRSSNTLLCFPRSCVTWKRNSQLLNLRDFSNLTSVHLEVTGDIWKVKLWATGPTICLTVKVYTSISFSTLYKTMCWIHIYIYNFFNLFFILCRITNCCVGGRCSDVCNWANITATFWIRSTTKPTVPGWLFIPDGKYMLKLIETTHDNLIFCV